MEALILDLLNKKSPIRIHDVAFAAGYDELHETNRKAIRRVLQSLVVRGILQYSGTTRNRVYFLKTKPRPVRDPVNYNANFLEEYRPNKTAYLDEAVRVELLKIGHPEDTVHPAGTYARHILNRLLVDLSWNSSRLEGNTYSLLETKRLIELGEAAEGKDFTEAQMILNHKRAIEYVIDSCDEVSISAHTIYSVHALLSEGLLGNPKASGRIRQIEVGVSGTVYRPLSNPHLIQEYFEVLIQKLNLISDPFEQSFFSLVHLSYLQAFEDVNKRTARLIANIPLIKKNLRPLSFIEVDQKTYVQSILAVYEKNDIRLIKDLYQWAYQRSCRRYSGIQQVLGEPDRLRVRHRGDIQHIIQTVVLEKTPNNKLVPRIRSLIKALSLSESDTADLFRIIEIEIEGLHEGNIARFKIRPSELEVWKNMLEIQNESD